MCRATGWSTSHSRASSFAARRARLVSSSGTPETSMPSPPEQVTDQSSAGVAVTVENSEIAW